MSIILKSGFCHRYTVLSGVFLHIAYQHSPHYLSLSIQYILNIAVAGSEFSISTLLQAVFFQLSSPALRRQSCALTETGYGCPASIGVCYDCQCSTVGRKVCVPSDARMWHGLMCSLDLVIWQLD